MSPVSTADGQLRPSHRRTAVLEALKGCPRIVSAQELHMRMVAEGTRIGLSTVYRALRDAEETGRVDVVQAGTGEKRYRWRRGGEHRHYLVCRVCAASRPVGAEAVEAWVASVVSESGFAAVEHTVELAGVCARCQRAAD
ncbi:Fur family transcriptional regulator [Streptomyces sp. NPDC057245]|uniref:Fur family transcriptional regulator n=1 Tax=Streptomyces TaxID=1883 RepID=UPI001C1DE59A|nr:transcriptional repressor [Streptomyces sp. A108]MBU6530353.1 transcriptional repressor [Streptomyces sp. A108]